MSPSDHIRSGDLREADVHDEALRRDPEARGGRPRTERYGAAVLATGLALVLQTLLIPLFGSGPNASPFMMFFAAVIVAAWFGGLGPGLLAVGLSALLSWYFFLFPQFSLTLDSLGQALRLLIFAAEGTVISSLVEAMHSGRRRAEANAIRARENQESLARSEERFRTLADNISQLAWMADEKGWIFWYNERWFDYTGTTLEETQGWGWRTVHHPGHIDRVVERFRRSLDTGEPWEDTFPLRGKDGRYRWFLSRAMPIRDEEGRTVRWFGTNTDVTERREAEKALRRSEERYRAVIEQSAEGIYLLDASSGRILETNPTFQRMLGYTAEELEGMPIYDLVDHPREDVDSKMERTLEEQHLLITERRYRRKDGTVVHVEIGASALSFDGRRTICAAVRDITERKRSEERFRYLVRYASDIIVVLDRDGTILFESPAVERVLGFTPEERMGTNAFDYLHPEDRGLVAEQFARLAEEPGGRLSAEYRAQNREGQWRHFEAIGVNLLDDPVVRGIVVNSRDVTERKKAEEALAEIREAERNRIARELHDGVLQDISYVAQAMDVIRVKYEGTGVENDLEEKAEAIRGAARGLREAIYDLRVYRHQDLKGRQILESLVELNRGRMPGCKIDLDVEEDFFDRISERCAPELLRIVQEALTNVRRHSGARNAWVSLGSSGAAIRVEVGDDGRGFDPGAASGMGTRGMRERVRALGGELEVDSEPGVGTTVRFEVFPEDLPD